MTDPIDPQPIALFRYGLIVDLLQMSPGSRGLLAQALVQAAAARGQVQHIGDEGSTART